MKAGSTFETSVNFYRIIRRSIPEDSHLRILIKFATSLLTKTHLTN
jgi:hypothetical protein